MNENRKAKKAVIVGGSIAGVSCAHSLILAGWDVVVVEKSCVPPKGSSTGAGLSLDTQALHIIQSWLPQPNLVYDSTLPLTIDQNHMIDEESRVTRVLTRDDNFNFRAAHWADLHDLLRSGLPSEVFLWGHMCISFTVSEDKNSVSIKAKDLQNNEIVEISGNLLVAADGCLSSIRRAFLPDLKLRYSGYYAWRGVLDFSENENSETISGIRRAYPDLGRCLYFELNTGTHTVFYELTNKRFNWIWYVNHPEPEQKGNSVTMKVSTEMIQKMYQEAEKVWAPELVRVIKDTKEPFINIIYDCDPLQRVFWDNIVLIGDAAHPTTPHCLRSTNMSILDAAVLGKCLEKWGANNLNLALEEYQHVRVSVTSTQVMHSRRVGRIKQGLPVPDRKPLDPRTASTEECDELRQKNMPFFASVPLSVD